MASTISESHTPRPQNPSIARLLTHARTAPIEVTLRSADGLDETPERKVTLAPNSTVTIGRSSRNPAKGLMASSNNFYIDSPVVSRQHAVLALKPTAAGRPAVFISDKQSTHGTMVNDKPLKPDDDYELHDGDSVQIGNDVARDKGKQTGFPTSGPSPHSRAQADDHFAIPEFFTAKKYHFTSTLGAPLRDSAFSKGFSAPDPVSSDGEDEDDDKELPHFIGQAPRYGTQTNPVNVDDFEEDTIGKLVEQRITSIVADAGPSVAGLHVARDEKYTPNSPAYEPQSPHQFSSLEDDEGAEYEAEFDIETESQQDSVSDQSSEADMGLDDEDNGSDVDSMDISDADSSLGSLCPDESAQNDDADVLRRFKLNAMIFHQERNGTEEAAQPERRTPSPPPALESPASPPSAQAPIVNPEPSPYLPREPFPPARFSSSQYPEHAMWGRSGEPAATSRPSAPKAWVGLSNTMNFGGSSGAYRQPQNMFYDAPFDMYPMMPDYQAASISTPAEPIFARTKAYAPLPFADFTMDNDEHSNGPPTGSTAAATGVPTPPMPSSPEMSAAPITPQQPQRTKVSIAEIVEEAPQAQQAPTPLSIASPPSPPTLKRKADAMEKEEPVVEQTEEHMVPVVSAPAPVSVPAAARREKKRKTNNGGRTWLKAAFQTTATLATGALIGGAATVYTLLNAPSSWGLEDM
jgi:hypothetical protein